MTVDYPDVEQEDPADDVTGDPGDPGGTLSRPGTGTLKLETPHLELEDDDDTHVSASEADAHQLQHGVPQRPPQAGGLGDH